MTIYLVRHASAGSRNDADPSDSDRAIDETGTRQASKLAAWLRHEPIGRVLSSPYRRCVQSVQPLADALSLGVEPSEPLAEGTEVDLSWSAAAEAAATGDTVVLCSHGDVIGNLIRRAQMRGMVVPGKSGAAKGSVWTLQHWDGQVFATGVYTPIPGS